MINLQVFGQCSSPVCSMPRSYLQACLDGKNELLMSKSNLQASLVADSARGRYREPYDAPLPQLNIIHYLSQILFVGERQIPIITGHHPVNATPRPRHCIHGMGPLPLKSPFLFISDGHIALPPCTKPFLLGLVAPLLHHGSNFCQSPVRWRRIDFSPLALNPSSSTLWHTPCTM